VAIYPVLPNARLIAKAPEMLKNLEELIRIAEVYHPDGPFVPADEHDKMLAEALVQANALLAEIEGVTP